MRPQRPSPNHIWITTWAEYDADGTLLREEGYWYEGPLALATTMNPVTEQEHYRIRDDNTAANPGTPNWISTEDQGTRTVIDVDTMFRIRFTIANTGTANANSTWTLRFSHQGGAYTAVAASGTAVITANATTPTDGDALTVANFLLTAGTGTATNGEYDEDNSISNNLANGTYTEYEFCVQLNSAVAGGIADGDTFDFRVYADGSALNQYDVTALVEANVPAKEADGAVTLAGPTASGFAVNPPLIAKDSNTTGSGTLTFSSSALGFIEENDVIVVVCQSAGPTDSFTDNNGVNSFTEVVDESITFGRYAVYARTAGASEPSSYSFNSTNSNSVGVLAVFRGIYLTDIWDVNPADVTGGTASTASVVTSNTISAGADNSIGLVVSIAEESPFLSSISSYESPYEEIIGENDTAAGLSIGWAENLGTAGTKGAIDATWSATIDNLFAVQFALATEAPAPKTATGAVTLEGPTASGTVDLAPKVWLNNTPTLAGANEQIVTAYNAAGTQITFSHPVGGFTGNLQLGVENRNLGGGESNTGWIAVTVNTAGVLEATGAVTLEAITAAGSVTQTYKLTGAVTLEEITASGTVVQVLKPSGAVTLGTITASGTVVQTLKPSGAVTLETITASGTVTRTLSATGAVTLEGPTASGTVVQTLKPSGAVTLESPTAAGTVVQTLKPSGAVTLSEITASGSVTQTLKPSGAVTLQGPTASGTVTQTLKPSGAVTLETIQASGTVLNALQATGAVTLEGPTASATVVQTLKPSGAVTLEGPTASGTAGFLQTATGAVTLSEITASGTVVQTLKPSGAVTLSEITASGTAGFLLEATGAVTLAEITASGTATAGSTLTATGAVTLEQVTASGTVVQTLKPSGAVTLEQITASGTAGFFTEVTGAVTLSEITASGTVVQTLKPSGAVTLAEITASGTAGFFTEATGAVTLGEITASGTVTQTQTLTGAVTLEGPTASGTVTQTLKPSGAVTLNELTVSGSVVQTYDVTGSVTLETITASGVAVLQGEKPASGAVTLEQLTATGTVVQTYKPTGTVTLESPTAAGTVVQTYVVTGSVTLSDILASGVVITIQTATGAVNLNEITASGSVVQTQTLTGAVTLETITAAGTVTTIQEATGAVTLDEITASGTATLAGEVLTATGAVTLDQLTAAGNAVQTLKPSGSVTLEQLTASGIVINQRLLTATGAVTLPTITASGVAATVGTAEPFGNRRHIAPMWN